MTAEERPDDAPPFACAGTRHRPRTRTQWCGPTARCLAERGPLAGLYGRDTFDATDLGKSYVAAIAAMHDPIDWAHPLAISTLRHPFGTSLLLTDALPLLTLPLRIAWQAGLTFDPAGALNLYNAALLVIAPLSLYALARALGGSRIAAVSSGVLVAGVPPLLQYPLFSEGLASWPLFALLLARFVRVERGETGREIWSTLIAMLLWWTHPVIGLLGLSFSGAYALGAPARRSARRLFPLVGSIVGLAAVWHASIPLPPGTVLELPGGFGSSAVPGLLSSGFANWSEITAETWGLLALVCFLLVQHRLWRLVPRLALAGLGLAVISLGAIENRGLLPIELLRATPFANLDAFDRLFLPAALLGVALAPSVLEDTLLRLSNRRASPPSFLRLQLPAIALAGLLAFYGGVPAGLTPAWMLEASGRSVEYGSDEATALPGVRALVRGRDRLLFLPDWQCESYRAHAEAYDPRTNPYGESPYDAAAFSAMAQEMGHAWLATTEGRPAYSFYTARMIHDAERTLDGVDCAHTGEPPPPGTLVVASTLFENDPTYVAPWESIPTGMAACSDEVEIGLVRGVRFCSDRAAAIDAFEAELFGLLGPVR